MGADSGSQPVLRHLTYSFFAKPPTGNAENPIIVGGSVNPAPAPAAGQPAIQIVPAGNVLYITNAHLNIETASDSSTERVFFLYTFHPNTTGAHFGDGNILAIIDAVLAASQPTNSATGGPAITGTGFLGSNATPLHKMTYCNGTQLPWYAPHIEVTEDMAVAFHQAGATDDTYDLELDGYLVKTG